MGFQEECLRAHNEYRQKHGVRPLKLNKQICKVSQEWADTLIKTSNLAHSGNKQFGENIFAIRSNAPNFSISGNEAVDSWYSEIDKYVFGREPNGLEAGHFTQVVWKNSQELGVGFAKLGERIIVVANYSPPGNYIGQYTDNVPPPLTTDRPYRLEKLEKEFKNLSLHHFDQKEFQREALEAHNKYRQKHGVAPLKLSKKICDVSKKWAETLITKPNLEHSNNEDYGENIYALRSSDENCTIAGNEAVDSWYSEISKHTFGVEPNDLSSGHFTQVVWKNCQELGIGCAKMGGRIIVVANYYPVGNIVSQFAKNVPPLTATVAGVTNQDCSKPCSQTKACSKTQNANNNNTGGSFLEECLKAHNDYRSQHGVSPLKLDAKLCDYSQEWANTLASKNKLEHRPNLTCGENIYYSYSSNPNFAISGHVAVDDWYDEIKKYRFGSESNGLGTGHFTQVVWKDSKLLGVGVAKSSGKIYVVCNYSPRGNYVGAHAQNVFPKI